MYRKRRSHAAWESPKPRSRNIWSAGSACWPMHSAANPRAPNFDARDPEPKTSRPMESRQQIEEIAAAWIARRDVGPWTDADAAGLQEWLAQSASHRAAYYRLNAAWEEAGRLRAFAGVSAQAGEGRGLNGHDDP